MENPMLDFEMEQSERLKKAFYQGYEAGKKDAEYYALHYDCKKNEVSEKVDGFISSVQEYAKLIHDVPGILIHPKDAERVLELLLCAEVHVTGTTQKGKIVIYKKDIVHPTTVDFPDWPMEKNI